MAYGMAASCGNRSCRITTRRSRSTRRVGARKSGCVAGPKYTRLPSSSLVGRKLSSTRSVLCASPKYLKAHGVPKHPAELARHAVIAYSLLSTGDTWSFEGPEGTVSVKVEPRMRTNSGDTCRVAALRHQGIVLQPSFLVGSDLLAGTLVEVMPAWRSIELGVYAIYPSRKFISPKVRLMIEFLVNAFSMRAWPA